MISLGRTEISLPRAGIYLRVSREDENTNISESIYNQRAFLESYIYDRGWMLVDMYSDDGFTGTNFERPEFKRLLQDIKSKKINTIIVKDLSRLGRDYIETGYYIEKYFPQNNVRFIAVNDGIDTFSDDTNNDMGPFRSVINDMYARDISKKVRTVMDTKRKKGEFIGAFAPYGYKKSDRNKNILVIDEAVASIVKKIYSLYLSGTGFEQIARILDSEGILSPGAYKKKLYPNYNNPKTGNFRWTAETVRYILTNPTYTGNMTQNKYRKTSYKVKKLIKISSKAWIIVSNTHEAIIYLADFEEVQKRIGRKSVSGYNRTGYSISGIVYCGDCGEKMTFTKTSNGRVYCICSGYKRNKSCKRHSILEADIEEALKKDIGDLIINNIDMDKLLKFTGAFLDNGDINVKKIKEYEERLSLIRNTEKKLYEDRVGGIISEEDFLQIIYEYRKESGSLIKKLDEARALSIRDNRKCEDLIQYIIEDKTFYRILILNLIEKILVFNDKSIKVFYKFKYNE